MSNKFVVDYSIVLDKANSSLSVVPRPFLRWAGSKRRLLHHLVPILPSQFRTYREPFLGSGALFFLLCPDQAILSDKCAELITAYSGLRDGALKVIHHLRPLKPDRDLFYKIRNRPTRGKWKHTANFIYLNKTCWNGLYRVNSQGRFNVPYGLPRTDFIADFENLRACSQVLQKPGVKLRSCDFEAALEDVKPGDLVYLDPPYITRHHNNGFIDYNETLFSWADQKRLAIRACQMAQKGVNVIVSNADHHEVLDLYRGFKRLILSRASTLASDPARRIRVKEAILYFLNTDERK